jgi:hypothetical protein
MIFRVVIIVTNSFLRLFKSKIIRILTFPQLCVLLPFVFYLKLKNSIPIFGFGSCYSYLSDSTGFLLAARQLCQLTVSKAITNAVIPANTKIHQLSSVL